MSLDLLFHPDQFLLYILHVSGMWSYLVIFLIIFLECSCILTPFLPGESLLFTLGALAAQNMIYLPILIIGLIFFAIAGYTCNYIVGKYLKEIIFKKFTAKKLENYLNKTELFYQKYGAKTLIIGRCVPIIRTYAPFFAGIVEMPFLQFMLFNIVGAFLWILIFTALGYLFGNLSIIKQHLNYVIFLIVTISILPILFEFIKKKKQLAN